MSTIQYPCHGHVREGIQVEKTFFARQKRHLGAYDGIKFKMKMTMKMIIMMMKMAIILMLDDDNTQKSSTTMTLWSEYTPLKYY